MFLERTKKPFLRRKLTIAALVLFISAIFLPWCLVTAGSLRGTSFFSFMVDFRIVTVSYPPLDIIEHSGRLFLFDFWFGSFVQHYIASSSIYQRPVGLNVGWFLVFLLQVTTLIVWFAELIGSPPRRGIWALLVLVFPWASFILGLTQCYVHSTIEYGQSGGIGALPHFGLWIVSISVFLLLISFWRSRETETLRKFGRRKLALSIVIVLLVGFLIANELEFQTGVTKGMYVEKTTEPGESLADAQEWTTDFNRILAVASLFRARIERNYPKHFYCYLEVPVVSYGALAHILNSMGYTAREPTFSHLFLQNQD
jgi:hypothetical protein